MHSFALTHSALRQEHWQHTDTHTHINTSKLRPFTCLGKKRKLLRGMLPVGKHVAHATASQANSTRVAGFHRTAGLSPRVNSKQNRSNTLFICIASGGCRWLAASRDTSTSGRRCRCYEDGPLEAEEHLNSAGCCSGWLPSERSSKVHVPMLYCKHLTHSVRTYI